MNLPDKITDDDLRNTAIYTEKLLADTINQLIDYLREKEMTIEITADQHSKLHVEKDIAQITRDLHRRTPDGRKIKNGWNARGEMK